jgi:DnaJ-class molecular chaperone
MNMEKMKTCPECGGDGWKKETQDIKGGPMPPNPPICPVCKGLKQVPDKP